MSTDAPVSLRLEVAVLPVTDVDRAKAFYEGLGWRLDADFPLADDYRIVQFTPPGSQASIHFGDGVTQATPGHSGSLILVVEDIDAARAELTRLGAAVSEPWHGRGPGGSGREPGPEPTRASYGTWASFTDPDGNEFLLQEIRERLPGRV